MSLFPAYAQDLGENNIDQEVACIPECSSVTLAQEAQLLESDNDEEQQSAPSPVPVERNSSQLDSDEYYLDRKFDCGNLRVSTLYYPGRPQYETQKRLAVGTCVFLTEGRGMKRRYFEVPLDVSPDSLAFDTELAERTKAYRQMLADQPTDEALWLRFIDFQERCRDAEAAMVAAESARERLPNSPRVRGALYRLRTRVLVPRRRLGLLREDLAECSKPVQNPELTTELWLRLLDTVAQCGDGSELDETAAAALSATRAFPSVYPHILYVYGGYLRSAGLWERLVLLLELVASMNFPPDVFPPAPDAARLDKMEQDLQETEDKAIASGLPLSTVWVRVERARAAAHWRAAAVLDAGADPQRTPLAADVAELLLPARAADAPLLLLQALRLAKVPLLPVAGYVTAALDLSNDAAGDSRWAACGEALLSLARAARRLGAAHPARAHGARGARALVAHFVDPPHYFTDDAGYLSWVSSLWEAGCSWTSGAARVAILCWRLRWMHALLLLLDTKEEAGAKEARRIRSEARLALKRWAGTSPLPFAQFARLEQAAAGPVPARRAALQALRAALRDHETPPVHRLYIARVVSEVCVGGPRDWWGAWATACSALQRELPDDEQLATPPPQDLLDAALRQCEFECTELEAGLESGGECSEQADARLVWALLPAGAEWAAARARLAPAPRRAQLLRLVCRAAEAPLSVSAARYYEQGGCALAQAAAREHGTVTCARALAPLFPHNAFLALACSGTSLWWCGAGRAPARGAAAGATHVCALSHVFPALLRAAATDWQPQDAARAVAACGRAARSGAGGALLHTARLEAEARAPRPRAAPALLTALDDYPHHKVVVEHANGRRCGGSLVSLRTALTSAWCVRGPNGGNPRELWALSLGVLSLPTPSRRVARVALVAGADADSPLPHLQPAWLGAALDIAVLELEAPFGGGAHSRPILMATGPEDCTTGTVCHIVRVRGHPPRLRIVDAMLVPGETCSAVAPGWPSLRDSALCLTGPMLCSMDRGAGVVCDGKLCGILSRSARAAGHASQNKSLDTTSVRENSDSTCGDVHVALSVARMRRFLHCAHTLRACGRGGECSHQCSERQLMVLEASEGDSASADIAANAERFYTSSSTIQRPTATTKFTTQRREPERNAFTQPSTTMGRFIPMFRTENSSPTRSVAPSTLTTGQTVLIQDPTSRPSFEFEPNRADFRGAPARTSRVYSKAGEYGDNAVDYGEAEESGMGGGPGALTTTTAVAMTTVPVTFTPMMLLSQSSPEGTSNLKHNMSTHTGCSSPKKMNISVKTKKPNSVADKPHLRLSKMNAHMTAINVTSEMRSLSFAAPRPCAFMSFVVFLICCFVN